MSSAKIYDPGYEWSEPVRQQREKERRESRRRHIAGSIALLVVAICASVYWGCSNAASTEGAQPREVYEGYWLEGGRVSNGELVVYDDLPVDARNSFKFRTLSIGEEKATVSRAADDASGKTSKWEPASDGLRIGNLFEHDDYEATEDGMLVNSGAYYVRYPEEGEPPLDGVSFGKISLQVPRDLAYEARAKGIQGGKSIVDLYSGRKNGPELIFEASENDYSGDLTELAEAGVGDYSDGTFVFCNGVNFLVRPDELQEDAVRHKAAVEFILGGMQYEVSFIYSDEDSLDYSNYAASFYQTIDTGSSLQASDLPEGARLWATAWMHLGEQVTAYGPVKGTSFHSASEYGQTYIDMGKQYPDEKRLSLIIWGEDRGNFPEAPENMYRDRTIAVTGVPYVYNDEAVYIKVSSPSQIQILE